MDVTLSIYCALNAIEVSLVVGTATKCVALLVETQIRENDVVVVSLRVLSAVVLTLAEFSLKRNILSRKTCLRIHSLNRTLVSEVEVLALSICDVDVESVALDVATNRYRTVATLEVVLLCIANVELEALHQQTTILGSIGACREDLLALRTYDNSTHKDVTISRVECDKIVVVREAVV